MNLTEAATKALEAFDLYRERHLVPAYFLTALADLRTALNSAELVTAPPESTAGEHPEDFCHKCGQPNISWFAPNQLWNQAVRAVNQPEMLCPVCFVKLTEIAGIGEQTWEVAPKNWHANKTQGSITKAFKVIDKAIENATPPTSTSDNARRAAEVAQSVVMAGRVVNINAHGEPTRVRLQEIQTSVSNGYEREYRKSGWSKALQFAIRDLHFLLTFFRDDVTAAAPADNE